jgi:hypothetical protein
MKNKQDLIDAYQKMNNRRDAKKRGFDFEKLFQELLAFEKLNPIPSYRPKGEQIDGFFEFRNLFIHLECKWEAKPQAASNIYTMQGKLAGKLIGCLGIFVSMSNFSTDAPEAIEKGKPIDILLFTKSDVDYCFSANYTFSDILYIKMRNAALYGSCLYEFATHLQISSDTKSKKDATKNITKKP